MKKLSIIIFILLLILCGCIMCVGVGEILINFGFVGGKIITMVIAVLISAICLLGLIISSKGLKDFILEELQPAAEIKETKSQKTMSKSKY